MMFGVHGGVEVGGGLVPGFLLPAAPVHEQAVAEAAELPDAARLNSGHCAEFHSAGGRLFTKCDGFRRVLAQVAAQERRMRTSGRPLLNSRLPASVAVAC
jgi:hypothetical protein